MRKHLQKITSLNKDNISKLGHFLQTRVPNDLTSPVLGWEIEQWTALKQCSRFCFTVRRIVCDVSSSQWIVFRGPRVYIIHFKVHSILHILSRVKLLGADTLFIPLHPPTTLTQPLPPLPAWGVRGKKPPLPASSSSSWSSSIPYNQIKITTDDDASNPTAAFKTVPINSWKKHQNALQDWGCAGDQMPYILIDLCFMTDFVDVPG